MEFTQSPMICEAGRNPGAGELYIDIVAIYYYQTISIIINNLRCCTRTAADVLGTGRNRAARPCPGSRLFWIYCRYRSRRARVCSTDGECRRNSRCRTPAPSSEHSWTGAGTRSGRASARASWALTGYRCPTRWPSLPRPRPTRTAYPRWCTTTVVAVAKRWSPPGRRCSAVALWPWTAAPRTGLRRWSPADGRPRVWRPSGRPVRLQHNTARHNNIVILRPMINARVYFNDIKRI